MIQEVVAGVACDEVVQRVAVAIHAEVPRQGQVLDVVLQCKRVPDRALHGIDPLIDAFGDRVARIVDNKGVVACCADHGVGCAGDGTRLNGRCIPDGSVCKLNTLYRLSGVAGELRDDCYLARPLVDCKMQCRTDSKQVHVRGQHATVQQNSVGSANFGQHIRTAPAPEEVRVVPTTSVVRVIAGTAIQRVVAVTGQGRGGDERVPKQLVVASPSEHLIVACVAV